MKYTDPDGRENTKYGITFISYQDYYQQETKRTNTSKGYIVQNKHINEKTTITYYGNNEQLLDKFQKENLIENRIVWDCEESYLPDDVKEILKNSGDKLIVETEKITIISNYIGLQGTEQT